MQDEVTMWRMKIVPSKGWKSSDIWEQLWQMKILFRKKLRAVWSQGNACYHSSQNLLSSILLSKNRKIKICRTIILHVVLFRCQTRSLILREENGLRVSENRELRRIFGPKRGEVTGEWRRLNNQEINDLYSLHKFVRVSKSRSMEWAGHEACTRRREVYAGFWCWNPRKRDHLEDLGVDGRIILRWTFRKWLVGGMDWIDLAEDRDTCWALVNAVMNLRVA